MGGLLYISSPSLSSLSTSPLYNITYPLTLYILIPIYIYYISIEILWLIYMSRVLLLVLYPLTYPRPTGSGGKGVYPPGSTGWGYKGLYRYICISQELSLLYNSLYPPLLYFYTISPSSLSLSPLYIHIPPISIYIYPDLYILYSYTSSMGYIYPPLPYRGIYTYRYSRED